LPPCPTTTSSLHSLNLQVFWMFISPP
jgi:hypothetical protein